MSGRLYHLLFWSLYLSLRGFIEYLWLQGTLPDFTESDYIAAAFLSTILESVPEACFVYFLSYRTWPMLENKRTSKYRYLLECFLFLIVCVFSVRYIFYHIVAPFILQGRFPVSEHFEFKRFMVILFNFITTSGVMVSLISVRKELLMKEREKNLIKEKLETELKWLRNQTHPHFLFNTLNNIYGLSIKKSEQAPEAIMKLSDLLHFMLYRSAEARIPLEEEIKILDDYIGLELLRYDERLTLNFSKEIDNPKKLVVPLLLLPLVENAFKHGASNSRFQSFIKITIRLKGEDLFFEVINSIENHGTNTLNNENIGLHSIRRQLELTYKRYDLTIIPAEDTFTAQLSLDLESFEYA